MTNNISLKTVQDAIRDVKDFPKKGILFKDITTALKNPDILHYISDTIYEYYKNKGITKVVGIESRGFILGSILAYKLNAGFVLLRKPGKLPADTYTVSYNKEYGKDSIEIHSDAINPNDVILLHDDLLATGGSAAAAIELLKKFGNNTIFCNFLIELTELKGTKLLKDTVNINSLIKY